jgi:hypothetical protein
MRGQAHNKNGRLGGTKPAIMVALISYFKTYGTGLRPQVH